MSHGSLVFEALLISTLAICENGIGEIDPFGQIGVEIIHVYSQNRDM